MKKYLLALSVLFVPFMASASTNITTVADQSVYVGDPVSVQVVVQRTGGHANPIVDALTTNNDWQSTEINGQCFNSPNLILGTGTATTTYNLPGSITASATTTNITVKVFRLDGCDDNLGFPGKPSEDSDTFELEVKEHPVPSSPSTPSKKRGGGTYMSPVYYGFTSETDKARWANYDERQKMLQEWRNKLCKEVGFACGK